MVHLEPSWSVVTGVLQLRRGLGAVERVASRHLRTHGLNVNEFLMLAVLADRLNATARVTDIAVHLGLTTGGATRLIKRARNRGYVYRSPNEDDKRSSLISMTLYGQQRLEEATPGFGDLVRAELDRDTDKRLEALARSITSGRPCDEHGGVRVGLLFIVVCVAAFAWGWFHSSSAPNGATLTFVLILAAVVLPPTIFIRWWKNADREAAAYTKRMESGMQQDTSGAHIWDA